MFMGAAPGSLVQDPVVCRFTERNNQCSVALGQQLHLQIPLEDSFNLKITDKTFNDRIILKYRKTQSNPPTPNIPGWQFVNDNKTLILTSAERSNSGTYTLEIFDAGGTLKGSYSLQLNIEIGITEYTPHILGFVCVLLIILSVIAFYIYKKKRGLMNKQVQSQDGKEMAYGQVTPLPSSSTERT
ncbi:carcinoembryonic antigen-related cell adhesion molecule 5-like isoform X1, partial [Clarias magur]